MPAHSEIQHLPYTPRQLFDLVADVARYPEFIPWCRAARILERKESEFMAELIVSFHHMTERYTSRVQLTPPEADRASAAIDVEMTKGPFEYLVNRWRFTPEGEGTRIEFFIDFKFRSRLLETLMGSFFTRASLKMMDAFKTRADALYGLNKQ